MTTTIRITATNRQPQAWTRAELRDVFTGATFASLQTLAYFPTTAETRAYQAGIEATVSAFCLACGLFFWPQQVTP